MRSFSKAREIKNIVFVFVAFVIPWLFVPLLSTKKDLGDFSIFAYYIMILPTSGIVFAQVFVSKKVKNAIQWIYILAFIVYTILAVLWGTGQIEFKLSREILTMLLVSFSIVLFIACCLGEPQMVPAYNGKKLLAVVGIFLGIELFFMLFPAFELTHLPLTVVKLLWTLVNTILSSAIILFGEEYAWRGYLLGKFQLVFGKRLGVILLGIVWEVWHLPYWLIVYESGMFEKTIGFSFSLFILLRVLNTVSMSVCLGWAYTKTDNLWCCVLIHGINNGLTGSAAAENEIMDSIPLMMFIRPAVLLLFLFTKEYRKASKE